MASIAVLVVAALPGTTSASSTSVLPLPPPQPPPPSTPILVDARLFDLLARQPPEPVIAVEPPAPASYFADAQIVSIYGHPDACGMGELGCHELDEAVTVVRDLARQYDEVNGARNVLPALHLIVDVAQPTKQDDGSYLDQMDLERVREYVEAARENGLLLFLDLQVGWSDPLDDVVRLYSALREPFVHVALDPEFATQAQKQAPGRVIGSLTAEQINQVQHYLAGLVEAKDLPPKILVVHQFLPSMIVDAEDLADVPEVDLTIDMDGFGPPWPKADGYAAYARSDYAEYAGFKLFFHWDEPLLTPAEVMGMPDPPDYVIYQ